LFSEGKIKRAKARLSLRERSVCLHIVFRTSQQHYFRAMRGGRRTTVVDFVRRFNLMRGVASDVRHGPFRILHDMMRNASIFFDPCFSTVATREFVSDCLVMAGDDNNDFHIRPGRSRSGGTRAGARPQSFVKRVESAVRKAGGNPSRIGGPAGKGSGRFNARGRGAKAAASLSAESGGWRRDSAGRFRARRVVVKARVVKLNRQGRVGKPGPKSRGGASRAVDAHLRYLERDGVTQEGEKGRAYSANENEADGRAFIERGRGDRHQFRFIVAPEDAEEIGDLRRLTRDLMRQMERDLDTRLDWIAVDHHNTGHPHTHVIVRGVTEDGKILNIAGDYIAHGVRQRASELVTLEMGHQSEIEVARKLASEVDAERLTRLDRMLIAEQRDQGVVDLRPGEGVSYPIRENRHLLISRARGLERYGLATEVEPGRWAIADKAEATLKALGERGDIIKTMHRALADHGLAEARGADQYLLHGDLAGAPIIGRVLGKGLAGDEMGERVYLIVDGVDARVHHIEFADPNRVEDVRAGMIVEAKPVVGEPRAADRNIAIVATDDGGIYRPSRHIDRIRENFERQGKDPDAFVRFHVRRLEALRRAGHVERIGADNWRVPDDIAERGMRYDLSRGGDGLSVRVLSTFDLEAQIGGDGATWLDRELTSPSRTPVTQAGFGRDVATALDRRKQTLMERGYASRLPDGGFHAPGDLLDRLERAEVARVGRAMAAKRGSTFKEAKTGDYVSGKLVGSTQLASGRFAMIDDGLGFSLVPWQPVLDKRLDQHIAGVMRGGGGIEWSFGRKRGLGL
jgi:type IV secretory pathway VirD2 relaxase